jgi:MFS family permease
LEESKYIPDAIEAIIVPVLAQDKRASIVSTGGITSSQQNEKKVEDEANSTSQVPDPRKFSVVSITYNPEQGDERKRVVEINHSIPLRPWKRRFALWTTDGSNQSNYEWWRHLYQPFAVIFIFPTIAFAAIQWAFCLSALSLVAVSTSDLYPLPPYNFSAAGVGNLNIPPAIGSIIGAVWGGPIVDYVIVKLSQRNNGIYEPEMRLTLFALPGILMPIGVFMYGLTTAEGKAWIIPSIGSGFIGFAIGGTGDIALTYLQDSYTEILADALIGVAFVRNIMAMILVFAIGPWFDGMGVYNAFVLLGCISTAFSLLCIPMYFFGKKYRVKRAEKYRYYAAKQFTIRSV